MARRRGDNPWSLFDGDSSASRPGNGPGNPRVAEPSQGRRSVMHPLAHINTAAEWAAGNMLELDDMCEDHELDEWLFQQDPRVCRTWTEWRNRFRSWLYADDILL